MNNENDSQNSSDALRCLTQHFNLDERILELLIKRGYDDVNKISTFLSPSTKDFRDTSLLNNAKNVFERIKQATMAKERILIFGDYDVDGISATAIMMKLIEKLGHKSFYYLPNRFIDGYGLTIDSINKVVEKYHPSLIITVDCGISCAKEVEYVKSKNIDIIVTDHHEISDEIPNCLVLNAKIPDQQYGFNGLCGAGLAYKIAYSMLGFENSLDLLTIACIATIADIVPLKDENRTIVTLGLQEMENNLPIGLKHLFKNQKINLKNLTASDIAFKIAPKINASGRMGEANDSLLLYTQTNPNFIKAQTQKILEHNTKRQEICNSVFDDCTLLLKSHNLAKEKVILLSSENWDSGILGIIASRLVDQYHRPVFLFASANGEMRGSGRSVDEVNIHDLLLCSKDILQTFGGHTMAAGLTVSVEKFDEFCRRCQQYMDKNTDDILQKNEFDYDFEVSPNDINEKLINDIKKLEPFGCENEMPIFKCHAKNISASPLKNFPVHINIDLDKSISLIYFNGSKNLAKIKYCDKAIIYFKLQLNGIKRKNMLSGVVENIGFSSQLKSFVSSEGDAYYLNQIASIKNRNQKNTSYYNQNNLNQLLTDISSFGTLIVASTFESYQRFLNQKHPITFYQFELFDNSMSNGQNAIVYAPTSFNGFHNYSRIIFLDSILDAGYIANLNEETQADIYLPQSSSFNKKLFSSISTQRDDFGRVFFAIKNNHDGIYRSIFDYFNHVKKNCKMNINFSMFYFAFLVFCDLNIIELESQDSQLIIKITDKQSALNNSQIYNIANFIKKTIK